MHFKKLMDFKNEIVKYYINNKKVLAKTFYERLHNEKKEHYGTSKSLYVKDNNQEYKIDEWYY